MLEALAGIVSGIALMILRDTFYKGKNQQKIDAMEKQIKSLETNRDKMSESIGDLEQSNSAKDKQIETMVSDHKEIQGSITELNKNIGVNNQAIASLDATLKGVNTLLKHIIEGDLKIAR